MRQSKILTEAEFIAERDRLTLEASKVEGTEVATSAVPLVKEPDDLVARSAILCFGGNLTLVPKKAVLYTPPEYLSRLQATPESQILGWAEFIQLNQGWVSAFEVTQEQVEGKKPITEEAIEKMKKDGYLVISTLLGNPITVLPHAPSPDAEGSSNPKPSEK